MTRDRFQHIRALQFHAPDPVTFKSVRDPLYRCRWLLQHFQKRFADTAVPLGASSLDEISVRTKARSRARTCMPSKPDKYSLRFYAVIGWDALYVHSLWDNGSGNATRSTPAQRYTELFPSLRTPLYNTLSLPEINIEPKSATSLWVAMAGHQTRTYRSPSGRRLLISDNFYTRHTYARAISAFTDDEVRLLGTVRMNLLRSTNPTRRREKRLHMSVFTWLLDISIINTYALERVIGGSASARVTLREFKREIADKLTRNEKTLKQQRDRRQQKRKAGALDEAVGSVDSLHIITPNSTEHSNGKLTCYLCSLRGMAKKAKYGCTKCERGFHVECFRAFHYEGAFRSNAPQLQDALEAIARAPTGDPVAFTRKRSNRTIRPISERKLP
ncbi:hypothetical protein PHYSODRAFT_518952 [Phytophthora sojae]|uniref:PiggyBac transposable element-derived protein domain-containing protein n=1 Tax=Phytophthora sojae (strain P6497) TaxID=1094619 RepID=G4ZZQ8_PHYSP|nr:hypothetical protein PHYSODRAFT_518952 [Phytophthora sojae]EGZ10404.1 hypothetical protein PHYSODRAFT_518952 [Phytophthora sojae]|eukprot:XP_009533149.1 hypothetical protein PHYSODRAFT_518952 [Phytophthora sojae]